LDTRAKATLVAFDLSRKDQYFKIRFENDPQGSGIELKEFIDKLTTEKINEVIKKNLERKGHWPDQYGKDESNDSDDTNENSKTEEDNSVPLNTILYGPPGTGKTYKTAQKAIEICGAKGKDRPAIMDEYKKLCDGKRISFVTFHQSYGYEEFVEGLRPMLKDDTPSDKLKVETVPVVAKSARDVQYEIRDGAFKMLCEVARGKDELYVIIIDEINRGNISKIFGELISLIEEDKRSGEVNELTVTLPYSQEAFSVPKNVYIIGTMNTADRSLALVDTALRRRFHFEETMPDTQVLDELTINGVDISLMLATMNRRIEALYDREHTIGHAYFTELMGIEKGNKFNALKNIFQNKIIPLLEEYFFEDWEKIRKVLGDNQKKDAAHQFITSAPCEWQELFGEKQDDDFHQADEKKTYTFNEVAFGKPQSYIEIYQR
jgi:5-methylcytosine-specific restriction protein B